VDAGLRCEVLSAGEMQAMLWRKLIVNAAINPIASLLGGPNKVRSSCLRLPIHQLQ
jgi:ketopantoate reductase